MPLETATYINTLNSGNPAEDDLAVDGDDHIRLLKAVLLATFPTITGPVTPTLAEINKLSGMTATGVELNKLSGVTVTTAEINRLGGITGNIQATLNGMNVTYTDALAAITVAWSDAVAATNATVATKQATLGFTPVKQGGGTNMGTATIQVGSDLLSPSKLRAQINATPLGFVVTGATETVAQEIVGLQVGAIGDIAMMSLRGSLAPTPINPGDIVSGSLLGWCCIWGENILHANVHSSVPSGTWKALCYVPSIGGDNVFAGLFKRVT